MDDGTYVHGSQPGQRLRSARTFRGLDQVTLAKRAGINPSVVCRIEGSGGFPSMITLVRLADALDVSSDYLMGRSADERIPDNPPRKVDALERDIGRLSHAHRWIVAALVANLGEVDHRAEKQEAMIEWLQTERATGLTG